MIKKFTKEYFGNSYGWMVAFVIAVVSLILSPLITDPHWLTAYHYVLLAYVLLLNRDIYIKILHRDEASQRKAIADHSSRLAAVGVMAGGVAHEINNPLSIILGNVKNLMDLSNKFPDETKSEFNEKLEKIKKATQRITHIIQNLKLFSKQSGNDPMVKVALADTLKMALDFCQERFRNNKIELVIGPIPDVSINCHATQISQVFLSLLSNAFDSVKTQPDAKVQVGFAVEDQIVTISVSDNGPGVAEKIRNQIFTPFFSTKDTGDGAGLGLSIARAIVKNHAGDISLFATTDPTTFVFSLPVSA